MRSAAWADHPLFWRAANPAKLQRRRKAIRQRFRSMRQLLMNMSGVTVARMPRPVVQPGTVLIRVHYSLVSVGTEVAPLRPASVAAPDTPAIERGLDRARLLEHYFRASLRDPREAGRRRSQILEYVHSRRRELAVS